MNDKWLPEVIDFYAAVVDLDTGKRYRELDLLIRPRAKELDKENEAVHKISLEMLADKPMFPKVAKDIKEILESAPIVIGHNLSYDKEVIDIEMARIGMEVAWPRNICTVEQTVHLKGFRLSLINLHELLTGETFADAHRAGVDTQALIRCALELRKRGEI